MVVRKIASNAAAQAQKRFSQSHAAQVTMPMHTPGGGMAGEVQSSISEAKNVVSRVKPSSTLDIARGENNPVNFRDGKAPMHMTQKDLAQATSLTSGNRGVPSENFRSPGGTTASMPGSPSRYMENYSGRGGNTGGPSNFSSVGGRGAGGNVDFSAFTSGVSNGSLGGSINTMKGTTARAGDYSFSNRDSIGATKSAGMPKSVTDAMGMAADKGNDAYNWATKKIGLTEAGSAPANFSDKSMFGAAKEAFSWMNRGSGSDVAKKWGTYGAAAVGTRMATGGGITYNSSGQSDIAGIPFI